MTKASDTPIFDAALAAHAVGINILPIQLKKPARARLSRDPKTGRRPWRQWGSGGVRQSREDVEKLFAPHGFFPEPPGLAVIGGSVSGGLVLFDFDNHAIYHQFTKKMRTRHHGALLKQLSEGFHVRTPNGHRLAAFVEGESGIRCQKWARRVTDGGLKAVIELKAEGGYAVVAPSQPDAHPSGKLYKQIAGSFKTIPRITEDELNVVESVCRSFDDAEATAALRRHVPVVKCSHPALDLLKPPGASGKPVDLNPYVDFDARVEWASILEPAGWTLVEEHERTDKNEEWTWTEQYWRRPGKDGGHSATTNYEGKGRLYVFSTSTIFESWEESMRSYLPHEAWALLTGHSGSQSFEIQTALRGAGYGTKLR